MYVAVSIIDKTNRMSSLALRNFLFTQFKGQLSLSIKFIEIMKFKSKHHTNESNLPRHI